MKSKYLMTNSNFQYNNVNENAKFPRNSVTNELINVNYYSNFGIRTQIIAKDEKQK